MEFACEFLTLVWQNGAIFEFDRKSNYRIFVSWSQHNHDRLVLQGLVW